MPIEISIAMATYNGERFLQEQLDSLVEQTYRPFELVVCDDGSEDQTLAILSQFAKSAPFPVHIHLNDRNLGYGENFLKAASRCEGEWIGFCDQDDVWFPEKLKTLAQAISNYGDVNLLQVVHSADRVTADMRLVGKRSPNFKRTRAFQRNQHFGFWAVPGFSFVFRRTLIRDFDWSIRPKDFNSGEKQAHDLWICMLSNTLGEILTLSESLSFWRRHSNAKTRSDSDIRAMSAWEKVKNSQKFGEGLYEFRASVARQSAGTLAELAKDPRREVGEIEKLKTGSTLFSDLAERLKKRQKLYSSGHFLKRLALQISLLRMGAYFGKPFYAFGVQSFFKDVFEVFFQKFRRID